MTALRAGGKAKPSPASEFLEVCLLLYKTNNALSPLAMPLI